MFGMQSSMNSIQIMNVLNQNPMMKMMTYSLIQNPMMLNQMMNILNTLFYNPMLMNEIQNIMNQELITNNLMMNYMNYLMNMNNMMNRKNIVENPPM